MTQIIPTLLAITEEEYKTAINQIQSCAELQDKWVQIDVMDNKFVPNQSVGLDIIRKYPLSMKKEAQLMVLNPNEWIDELADLGFSRIIFPVEIGNTEEWINKIKNKGMGVGLSINPETSAVGSSPFLKGIDEVLIMGVHPGFQGQEFLSVTWEKIQQVLKYKAPYDFIIGIDGGIKLELVKKLVDAGVDNLAIGSALFKGNFNQNLQNFMEQLNG